MLQDEQCPRRSRGGDNRERSPMLDDTLVTSQECQSNDGNWKHRCPAWKVKPLDLVHFLIVCPVLITVMSVCVHEQTSWQTITSTVLYGVYQILHAAWWCGRLGAYCLFLDKLEVDIWFYKCAILIFAVLQLQLPLFPTDCYKNPNRVKINHCWFCIRLSTIPEIEVGF